MVLTGHVVVSRGHFVDVAACLSDDGLIERLSSSNLDLLGDGRLHSLEDLVEHVGILAVLRRVAKKSCLVVVMLDAFSGASLTRVHGTEIVLQGQVVPAIVDLWLH